MSGNLIRRVPFSLFLPFLDVNCNPRCETDGRTNSINRFASVITSSLRSLVASCIARGLKLPSSPMCHSSAYARSEAANSIIKSGVKCILAIIRLDRRSILSVQVARSRRSRKRDSFYVSNNPKGRGPLSLYNVSWP